MRSAADYSSYFSENFPNGTVGVLGASNVANVTFPAHAAAFRYIDEGGTALVDRKTYMSGTIVHELGHLMDRLNNNVTQNPNSTFNQQLALDIADFNATGATPWAVACFNKIDQFLPAPSRVCGNFSSGTALWVVLQSAPAFTATPLEDLRIRVSTRKRDSSTLHSGHPRTTDPRKYLHGRRAQQRHTVNTRGCLLTRTDRLR